MKIIKNIFTVFALVVGLSVAAAAQTSLTSLDGTRVDLQGNRGKVVILAIGASWLPLSGAQAEVTNRLAKKYAGRDVVVYFVATDSADGKSKNFASNEGIRKFATTNKLTVPVLRDSDGLIVLKKYSVDQLPSFVIIDKSGAAVGPPFGGIDPNHDVSIPISSSVDKLL
jgi:peroxiredoxin